MVLDIRMQTENKHPMPSFLLRFSPVVSGFMFFGKGVIVDNIQIFKFFYLIEPQNNSIFGKCS